MQERASLGMTSADYAAEDNVEVRPENWLAYLVFLDLHTQWRTGFNGHVGFDYNVLPLVFELNGVAKELWPEVFASLRIMESAALREMRGDA